MTMSRMQQWTLASSVMMCGCQLGVELLESSDEADDTGEDIENGDGGDGDGDGGAPSDECIVQGTNLGGGSDPAPLPQCEVECATGWGHGVAPLANEWTLDLQHEGENTGFTHLRQLPNDDLLAMIGWFDAPARLVWISPTGELLDELTQPAIDGDLWSVDVDASGTIYAIWADDGMQSLTALASDGQELWTNQLGPHLANHSVLAALDSGVMVALNPADPLEASQLLKVSSGGGVKSMGAIPLTWQIAVSPSGNTVAVANTTTIRWTDFGLFPTWTASQGVADAQSVLGLAALDDQRVASVGTSLNWDEDGSLHGYVKQIGPMGLEWESRYDRATAWCGDTTDPTEETLIGVTLLADGSLLVVGSETGGLQTEQPVVFHVSAEGEVLASDRGYWQGQAAAAVADSDGSAYVLMLAFDDASNQQLYIRKYAP